MPVNHRKASNDNLDVPSRFSADTVIQISFLPSREQEAGEQETEKAGEREAESGKRKALYQRSTTKKEQAINLVIQTDGQHGAAIAVQAR